MLAPAPYPHLETPTGQPAHLKRLPRIHVAQIVMDYLTHGWSVDEICHQHPYLLPAEAHAAMTYYFDHPAEIEAEIEAEIQQEVTELQAIRATAAPSRFRTRMAAEARL
jgi:uncharacterized protein (DUF433 family)